MRSLSGSWKAPIPNCLVFTVTQDVRQDAYPQAVSVSAEHRRSGLAAAIAVAMATGTGLGVLA